MMWARAPRWRCCRPDRVWLQAQTSYAQSRYDYLIDIIALRLAAGTLTARRWSRSTNGSPRPRTARSHPGRRRPALVPSSGASSAMRRAQAPRFSATTCSALRAHALALLRIAQQLRHRTPQFRGIAAPRAPPPRRQQRLQDFAGIGVVRPVSTGRDQAPRAPADCGRRPAPDCRRRRPRRPPHRSPAAAPSHPRAAPARRRSPARRATAARSAPARARSHSATAAKRRG